MHPTESGSDSHTAHPEPEVALRAGAISLRQAILYGIATLGVGDFLASSGAYFFGSGSGQSTLFGLAGGFVLVAVLSRFVTRWARTHVASGSLMSYVHLEIGPRSGMFTGAALLMGYLAEVGAYVGGVLYFGFSFLSGLGVPYPTNPVSVVLTGILLVLVASLVRRGVDVSVKATIVLGYLIVPVALVAVGAAAVHEGVDLRGAMSPSGFSVGGFVAAVVMMFGFFAGFEGLTALARETKDPRKSIPVAVNTLLAVMFVVMVSSIVLTFSIMEANADALAEGASPFHVLAEAGGLPWIGPLGDLLLFLALLGSLIAFTTDGSRVAATAGKDGLLPAVLGRLDRKRQTPTVATAVIVAMGFVLVVVATYTSPDGFFGTTVAFTQMVGLSWLVAYVVASIASGVTAWREKRLLTVGLAIGTTAALVAIMAYYLTHIESSFVALFASIAAIGIPLLWLQAVLRHRSRSDQTSN